MINRFNDILGIKFFIFESFELDGMLNKPKNKEFKT